MQKVKKLENTVQLRSKYLSVKQYFAVTQMIIKLLVNRLIIFDQEKNNL